MEGPKKSEGTTPAAPDTAEAMRQKYGKVYKVGVSVPVDDEAEKELSYHFKRPSIPVYDRFVKTMSKIGISKASKTFILDSVVDEDKERLTADMEEYPGISITIGNKLGELLGTIGDGILNLLQTALEKIFGGLIDLVNSLFENLAKLLDLFGSVGEAFQVLWTWLPPEVTAILVAGVSIFVFVALLKFFMK